MEQIQRLTRICALSAFVIPFLPIAIGAPRAGMCGNAPLPGSPECALFSFTLLLASAVGLWAMHPQFPRRLRRLTLGRTIGVGFLYFLFVLASTV